MRILGRLLVATLTIGWYALSDVSTEFAGAAKSARAASVRGCSRFASPSGSDSTGRGTRRRPFRSVTRLDRALAPGRTGCLEGGVYGDLQAWHPLFTSGQAGAPVTIRSVPGQMATIDGWVDVEGSYVTVEHVRIDGSNTLFREHAPGISCPNHVSQPLVIAGSHDILQYVNYFQSVPGLRGTGIALGFWGSSNYITIRHNKIHDVGGCDFYDHLIYLASGYDDRIYDNWMWNDPHGWGVKLDPGPHDARVWGNVIDHAGSGFNFGNSEGGASTSGNLVYHNIVLNSVGVSNPDIHWSHPGVLVTSPGMVSASNGNAVFNNISYHNPGGIRDINRSVQPWQLRLYHNVTRAPRFVNRALHNYSLRVHRASAHRRRHRSR